MSAHSIVPSNAHPYIVPAQTAWITAEKQELLRSLRQANQEGVVMKEINAAYEPGRPNSGGPALKHKFYATGSFIVAGINDQRSVSLRLFDSERTCGNVTIPPNHPVPRIGAVVEIRFLYAYRESGCLYQPLYLQRRDDIDPSDCRVDQLKFKSAEAEDES